MTTALVHVALVAYSGAAAAFLAWLLKPRGGIALAGRLLLFLGLAAHVASFAPSGGNLFSVLAAALVSTYLLLDASYRLPVAGVFVAPMAVAIMVPAHLRGGSLPIAHGLTHSVALAVHVGSSTLGTAALALAFLVSIVYLAGEQQLKAKRVGRVLQRLPSLEKLDHAGWKLVVWGFVFLSVSIATGSLASREANGPILAAGAKQVFALGAWGLLAALVQARLVAGWRGRRIAWLAVAGFLFVAGSYGALLSPAARVA